MESQTISQIIDNPNDFLSEENCFGFFDWFCNDKSLERKGVDLLKKFKRISNSKKINKDTMTIIFKNNCPMVGRLYDDFRICDSETGDVVFCVTPKSGFAKDFGVSSVYGKDENGEFNELYNGDWKGLISWFNS